MINQIESLYDIQSFLVGEVIDKLNTYKREDSEIDMLFTIDVAVRSRNGVINITDIKPYNSNFKQIPIVGEHVLIFQTIDHQSGFNKEFPQWYYLNSVSVQSGINNNILPTTFKTTELDPDFKEKRVSPLQPYIGDVLLEGRWGNSIRLGSTINTNNRYSKRPSWSGNRIGDAIMILSTTTRAEDSKNFIVETTRDTKASSVYLTTSQKIEDLKLSKSLIKFKKESQFERNQIIGVSDRIILRAYRDIALLDSEKAIVLNSPNVLIGNDGANQPLVLGNDLYDVLRKMLDLMTFGYQSTAGQPVIHTRTNEINRLKESLFKIKSKKHKIDK
jgi:hypothetical protein